MDPLSALSLASSVVQFVQFGGSLVSKSRQIYEHGKLQSNIDFEEAVHRLTALTGGVKSSLGDLNDLGQLSRSSKAMKDICERCEKLGDELLVRSNALQLDDKQKHRKWKSFRQAFKSMSSKKAVDQLSQSLRDCREELDSHILLSIKYAFLCFSFRSRS